MRIHRGGGGDVGIADRVVFGRLDPQVYVGAAAAERVGKQLGGPIGLRFADRELVPLFAAQPDEPGHRQAARRLDAEVAAVDREMLEEPEGIAQLALPCCVKNVPSVCPPPEKLAIAPRGSTL